MPKKKNVRVCSNEHFLYALVIDILYLSLSEENENRIMKS